VAGIVGFELSAASHLLTLQLQHGSVLVLFVADLFHPVGRLAVKLLLNGDMGIAVVAVAPSPTRAVTIRFWPGGRVEQRVNPHRAG
jgi:hypothetical protein